MFDDFIFTLPRCFRIVIGLEPDFHAWHPIIRDRKPKKRDVFLCMIWLCKSRLLAKLVVFVGVGYVARPMATAARHHHAFSFACSSKGTAPTESYGWVLRFIWWVIGTEVFTLCDSFHFMHFWLYYLLFSLPPLILRGSFEKHVLSHLCSTINITNPSTWTWDASACGCPSILSTRNLPPPSDGHPRATANVQLLLLPTTPPNSLASWFGNLTTFSIISSHVTNTCNSWPYIYSIQPYILVMLQSEVATSAYWWS